MKFYLTDRKEHFKKHLDYLKNQPVRVYDRDKLSEKISTVEIAVTKTLDRLDLTFLFNYAIFPENIMTYLTQWQEENREMQIGDTIFQQAYIPPFRNFSQKIIFGVRINEIIDEPHRKGFSYETLMGHVENSISTFTIEQLHNTIVFKIRTYSVPGNFLTKLLGPFFSVPYQAYCTRKALENVKRQIEKR